MLPDASLPGAGTEPPRPRAGLKLYSPGALAGYTALTCLPFGYVLYGLNLKARGHRKLGLSWILLGAAALAFIFFMPARLTPVSSILFGSGAFGAITIFRRESGPFALAMAQGGARARWWPPALVILTVVILYGVIAWFIA